MNVVEVGESAAKQFGAAARLSFEDAGPGRLRYHLLRLTLAGLTQDDVEDLRVLGGLAFDELDVTEQATKITARQDASALAVAIASILLEATHGLGDVVRMKGVLFGAVLGAYAAIGTSPNPERASEAVTGAIAGAVAVATSTLVGERIDRQSWEEYLQAPE